MKAQVHNLAHIRRDRGYRFTDRDPDMTWLCGIIHNSELSVHDISERTAKVTGGAAKVSNSTISNWLSGKTKRPQNMTLTWVAWALGYEKKWSKF